MSTNVSNRAGKNTTEFIVIIATAIAAILEGLGVVEFPKEAFITLIGWVAVRIGEKAFSKTVVEKRAWRTSEFYVGVLASVLRVVFPDIPEVVYTTAYAWILGRPIAKVTDTYKK